MRGALVGTRTEKAPREQRNFVIFSMKNLNFEEKLQNCIKVIIYRGGARISVCGNTLEGQPRRGVRGGAEPLDAEESAKIFKKYFLRK